MKSRLGMLALFFLASCHGGTHPVTDPNLVRISLPTEPQSLDPALSEDDVSVRILANVNEGLMGYDGAGTLQKKLAESIEISPDRRRYAFTLRKNAQWSDGRPLTAQDFVFGIKRSLDPKLAAKLANMLFSIKGAKAYHSGTGSASQVGVRAENGKLTIELEKPASYFLHALTISQASPMREDLLENGQWNAAKAASGPYRVARLDDQEIRLEPNEKYWDPSPRLPVALKIIVDESTAVALFEAGKLDIVSRLPALDVARLKTTGVIREFPQVTTYFLSFNTRKPPFNDRAFRRAVAGSIDREGIVAALGATGNRPARSWIPPGLEGFLAYQKPDAIYAKSVAEVREKLKKTPLSVTATFNTGNQNSTVMEKVQADLTQKLGLTVLLSNMDWKTYLGTLKNDPPQIYRFGRTASFMDPIWHFVSFTGDDANNPTGWKNPEYDRLVEEIATIPPGPARLAKILRAQKILTDDEAVVVPVYHYVQSYAISPRLSGVRVSPGNVIPFSEVSLSRP